MSSDGQSPAGRRREPRLTPRSSVRAAKQDEAGKKLADVRLDLEARPVDPEHPQKRVLAGKMVRSRQEPLGVTLRMDGGYPSSGLVPLQVIVDAGRCRGTFFLNLRREGSIFDLVLPDVRDYINLQIRTC